MECNIHRSREVSRKLRNEQDRWLGGSTTEKGPKLENIHPCTSWFTLIIPQKGYLWNAIAREAAEFLPTKLSSLITTRIIYVSLLVQTSVSFIKKLVYCSL